MTTTTYDFETGDTSRWDVVNILSAVTDRVHAGSYAGYSQSSDTPGTSLAEETPDDLVGGNQIVKFEYWWQETSAGSYGGGIRLVNSNGNFELGLASDNPEWVIDDANGTEVVKSDDNNYDRWVRFTVTFDWANGTFDYDFEDPTAGTTRSGTGRPLKAGVDIETIVLENYNSAAGGFRKSGDSIEQWWDDILVDTGVDIIVIDAHSVLLNHMPLFDGRFSPHKILLNHFKAVPTQPHVVNLVHQPVDTLTDTSEEGQAKALRALLGYGWGVPDPPRSAKEKIEIPRESWPTDRFDEAERLLRQEGVDEDTAKGVGEAMRRLGEDIQLDVRANLRQAEWHANAHTHEPGDTDRTIKQIDSNCGPGPAMWLRFHGPDGVEPVVRHDEHGGGLSSQIPKSIYGPYGPAAAVDPGDEGDIDAGGGSCSGTHTIMARFQFYGSNGDGGIFVFADRPAGSNNFDASGRGFTKNGEDIIRYRIKTGGANSGNTWVWGIPVTMGIWHTIIARHDPETGEIRVWLDGAAAVFDNIGTDLEDISDGDMDFLAGQNNTGLRSYEVSGAALAEAISWDRPLTDEEIKNLIAVT